ncbi:MAG: cupin domain-containing protein [Candidatus Dormibacteria bacterium]
MSSATPPARTFSISEAAALVGVSPSTLRLWERQGLVRAARTPGGFRRFGEPDIEQLRAVHVLRRVEHLPAPRIRRELNRGAPPTVAPRPSTLATSSVGRRLHAARVQSGRSLRGLAAAAEVSPSYVSAIERGLASPSVAMLTKLTAALDIGVHSLRLEPRAPSALVRRGQAERLDTGTPGVEIENLAPAARQLEPQRFTIAPRASSGGGYRHEGEDFLHVVSGALEVWLDEAEHYRVEVGDSLCFPSTRVHRWENPGAEPAVVIWVNTPPSF